MSYPDKPKWLQRLDAIMLVVALICLIQWPIVMIVLKILEENK